MANIQYYDVIIRPVITEKTMNQISEKKYTFFVHTDANKAMIKEAVEKMFDGVKVSAVNTMNYKGKPTRRGRNFGKKADKKKAVVTLTPDSKEIVLFEGL